MASRRSFLSLASLSSVLCAMGVRPGRAAIASLPPSETASVYERIGVRTIINAGEPFTAHGGSPIRPEVLAAMDSVSRAKARLDEVHDAVGRRLSELLGVGGAMVSSGAAGALTVGVAACITGNDLAKIKRLPHLSADDKNEVIIQKAHRYDYEHAVRNCGVTMVEVETAEQMRAAIGPRTACLLFNNRWTAEGLITPEAFVRIGKAAKVPSFIDCASDIPPASNLLKYQRIGFDLVAFSGGKGLRAPSSTGVLMGDRDLVAAARLNSSPNDDSIGRGMKIGHEELVGLMVAIEIALAETSDPLIAHSAQRLERIATAIRRPGIVVEAFEPPVSYRTPHIRITWDETGSRLTADAARRKLLSEEPRIYTRTGPDKVIGLELTGWMLTDADEAIIIKRLNQVLASAS